MAENANSSNIPTEIEIRFREVGQGDEDWLTIRTVIGPLENEYYHFVFTGKKGVEYEVQARLHYPQEYGGASGDWTTAAPVD